MKSITANEAKQSFGHVLDEVQSGPVLIRKHNRPAAVVMSVKDYDRMRGINLAEFTALCERVGQKARKRGLTSPMLKKILHGE